MTMFTRRPLGRSWSAIRNEIEDFSVIQRIMNHVIMSQRNFLAMSTLYSNTVGTRGTTRTVSYALIWYSAPRCAKGGPQPQEGTFNKNSRESLRVEARSLQNFSRGDRRSHHRILVTYSYDTYLLLSLGEPPRREEYLQYYCTGLESLVGGRILSQKHLQRACNTLVVAGLLSIHRR
jgi:hypothetical protein